MAADSYASSMVLEEATNADNLIYQYLEQNSDAFATLNRARALESLLPAANDHFQKIHVGSANQSPFTQQNFLRMMQNMCTEMQAVTKMFDLDENEPNILDIGAAPGGFTSIALQNYPKASVFAVTLPKFLGGYAWLLPYGEGDPRIKLRFLDITTLGLEHGLGENDLTNTMNKHRIWPDTSFDLVICGGTMTQLVETSQDEEQDQSPAQILRYSQLVVGMSRLAHGGTLVLVLHQIESWSTLCILQAFCKFASIQLFKSKKGNAVRSSFYLVAKDVQTDSEVARAAVKEWKEIWYQMTMRKAGLRKKMPTQQEPGLREVEHVLEVFGEQFIMLAEPIWTIQRDAILKAPWFKGEATMLS